jgi:phage gp36-like protein
MAFATRADLLARTNARQLAQWAVPADMPMPPEEGLRVAIAGGDLGGYTDDDRTSLAAALDAIDTALADAESLLISYGIPATVQARLLTRLATTVALYNLQGAERMTKEVQSMYDGAVKTLTAHARGDINLIPADPAAPAPIDDVAIIESAPSRYGRQAVGEGW